MQRVGIYAGTFDPIHNGHIAFALGAINGGIVDKVIFAPERSPRGKQTTSDISHRAAMIEQAVATIPEISVLALNDEHFTVKQTLPQLKALYKNAKLTFLMGSDVARSLEKWDDIALLIREASFVICTRSGDETKDIDDIMKTLELHQGHPISYILIDTPSKHIASTHIRNSRDNSHLHQTTQNYIRRHNLYL